MKMIPIDYVVNRLKVKELPHNNIDYEIRRSKCQGHRNLKKIPFPTTNKTNIYFTILRFERGLGSHEHDPYILEVSM